MPTRMASEGRTFAVALPEVRISILESRPQEWEIMTARQTLWSQKQKSLGLCWCGAKLTFYKSLCVKHAIMQRLRMRKRQLPKR
jgi:hypothetical protein